MKYKSMKTAPKDGRRILVFDGESENWETASRNVYSESFEGYIMIEKPVCWIPLPENPERGK